DMLVDAAPVAHDDAVDLGVEAPHQVVQLVRVQRLGKPGEADEVGEEDGDLAALARGPGGFGSGLAVQRPAAAAAEARARLVGESAALAGQRKGCAAGAAEAAPLPIVDAALRAAHG